MSNARKARQKDGTAKKPKEATFTHSVSGKQYTRKADGTCWYENLQITEREYGRAKEQNDRICASRKERRGSAQKGRSRPPKQKGRNHPEAGGTNQIVAHGGSK